MRRLIAIAAFALLLGVPAWSQRGGGGMHAGGFGGHVGTAHVSGGHSFSGLRSGGMRSSPGASHIFLPSSNHGPRNGFFPNHGTQTHNIRFHNFGFRNNCFGFPCRGFGRGYPGWGLGWGWDPWLWSSWDDEDRRFDQDYYGQLDMADRWNQQSLEEQRMLRQEEADGDQDAYAPNSSARRAAPTAQPQPEPVVPATVLVYRDQHREEVNNYAIVGQTLWSFSVQRTKKIPLSDLDVPATQKANDDRGVTFRVPGANEGQ